jgi:hypothetical protein
VIVRQSTPRRSGHDENRASRPAYARTVLIDRPRPSNGMRWRALREAAAELELDVRRVTLPAASSWAALT